MACACLGRINPVDLAIEGVQGAMAAGKAIGDARARALRRERISLGRPDTMAHEFSLTPTRASLGEITAVAGRPERRVSGLPRASAIASGRTMATFERFNDGELVLFALSDAGVLEFLPAGTRGRARTLIKQGHKLFVKSLITGTFMEFRPRRRKMNLFNLSAAKRANRRLDGLEKVLKNFVKIEGKTLKSKKRVRIKRRKGKK